jgi:hypothetical protein
MNINKLGATLLIASMALAGAQAVHAQDSAAAPAADAAAPAAEVAAAPNAQIVAFVDYQYPTADANGDGTLTGEEFTAWIGGLKAAELEKAGQTVDQTAVKTYTEGALRTADKDADKIVSKVELVTFFGG